MCCERGILKVAVAIYQVDAFTKEAFAGNPAVVCLIKTAVTDEWMQKVAMEMNVSETAFVMKEKDGFRLRWFTPEREVALCGHATLASAHILWEEKLIAENEVAKFYTQSGILTAAKFGQLIELNFPRKEVSEVVVPEHLRAALGNVELVYVGLEMDDYLVEVESEEILRQLTPNFELLKKLNSRGVIVTSCSSKSEFDFVSRFFAPQIGVNEDPVTGSSHCSLAPYWQTKLNKKELTAYQASNRGGIIHIRVENGRVVLGGEAVTVLKGELLK